MQPYEPPDGRRDSPDEIERLLRLAGPRAAADANRTRRVHSAVRGAWQESVRARARRRWVTYGGAGLAIAASVVFAMWLSRPGAPITAGPATTMAHLATASGPIMASTGAGTAATTVAIRIGDAVPSGAELSTADGTLATLSLSGGGEVRLDGNTAVTFVAARTLALKRGGIYLDSGAERGAPALTVHTPAGIVRDVGTRFEVRLADQQVRVRVRDGAVRLEHAGAQHEAVAGTELLTAVDGSVQTRAVAPYGRDWAWATRATSSFHAEGQTLSAFLDWVAREGGWTIEFAEPALRRALGSTILHGSVEGLSTEEALAVILPTCGLSERFAAGGRVTIRRTVSGGGGL